jgi:hypothetical protein
MARNDLKMVRQLRCTEKGCEREIRKVGEEDRCGGYPFPPSPVFEHVGEPCRRYYGKDPAEHEGFPVNRPEPILRCAACWPFEDMTEVGQAREDDPLGVITTSLEAYYDVTRCSSCTRENLYAIGD